MSISLLLSDSTGDCKCHKYMSTVTWYTVYISQIICSESSFLLVYVTSTCILRQKHAYACMLPLNVKWLLVTILTHLPLLHFLHPSLIHSFTLNSKLTFSASPFHHRSLTVDSPDWLARLVAPFYVLLCSSVLVSWFCPAD